MRKRILAFIMVLLVSLTSIAYADTITDKQNKLKESKNAIDELNNKLNSLKNSQKDVLEQINEIDSAMNEAQKLLDDVNAQINSINASIDKTQAELDKAIEEYEAQQELYANRVKAMYINGSVGYLEILLSSESFGDFISRMETVKTIVEFDKNILNEMKQKQEEIAAKKAELEQQKRDLAEVQSQYQQTVAQLKKANEEKQAYYEKIKNDMAAVQKAQAAEEAKSKALEAEIKKLQEEAANKNYGTDYSGYATGVLRVSDIGYVPPLTSPFGYRWHPVTKEYKLHTGMDLGVPTGTPVYAMADGKVILSEYSSSWGNYVIIYHGNGISSLYAHFSKRLVSVGETVKAGQKIGLSGSTGWSTGPHLHFEIRKDGTPIDPTPYYICGR